jgi:hypothetical protein
MAAVAALELPVNIDDSLKIESVQVISGLAFDNLKVLLTWLASQVKDQVSIAISVKFCSKPVGS